MNYKKEEADNLLKKLGIVLKPEDKDKDGKALLKVCFFRLYRYVLDINVHDDEFHSFFLTPLLIYNEGTLNLRDIQCPHASSLFLEFFFIIYDFSRLL